MKTITIALLFCTMGILIGGIVEWVAMSNKMKDAEQLMSEKLISMERTYLFGSVVNRMSSLLRLEAQRYDDLLKEEKDNLSSDLSALSTAYPINSMSERQIAFMQKVAIYWKTNSLSNAVPELDQQISNYFNQVDTIKEKQNDGNQ